MTRADPALDVPRAHVLLVDDDPVQLAAMREALAHACPQARIRVARTAQEAMPHLRRGAVALVVADLGLLRVARELQPGAARWLFTGEPLLDLPSADLAEAKPHGLVAKSEGLMGLARAFAGLAEA
ncbi:MAG: hypothetical protein QOE90_3334 [Thermoplasmata archaeon]|jgi:DNA-binding NarL/FixJ family response regulator|nr:hypothetical protein [Thermoplasmata archaeon]